MKCAVCGNKKGLCGLMETKKTFFHIHLSKDFKKHLLVPFFALKMFNKATGSFLYAKTADGEEYNFNILKSKDSSRIWGQEYQKFLRHYNMEHGEEIRLDTDYKRPFLFMIPIDKFGCDKSRVDDEFDFKNTARAIVISKGLELSNEEIARINKIVQDRGLGLGCVFVHTITKSDIESNNLHIPKFIVSAMEISRTASVKLVSNKEGVNKTGSYHISTDGRIRFKAGWMSFASVNKLVARSVVVILFKKTSQGLHISFDEVRF